MLTTMYVIVGIVLVVCAVLFFAGLGYGMSETYNDEE